ncbi:MAG: ATP-binding protein [Devosia sp.]
MSLAFLRRFATAVWNRRPRGIFGQFALLLVGAMVVANMIAISLLDSERSRAIREARRGAQVERIVSLVPVLEGVPERLRPEVAKAASSPILNLKIDDEPLVEHTEGDRLSRRIQGLLVEALDEALEDDGRDEVASEDVRVEALRHHRHWDDHDDDRRWWRRPVRLRTSIRLEDGSWLNARQGRTPRGPPGSGGAVVFALALSITAVLGVGLWFIGRITRPLRALGAAAERAGAGDRSAMVKVEGVGEVRAAAEAFNAMQTRIARFDAERARAIAAVGHDLRTPITSLRIRAEMLDGPERDAMVRTLDEMRVMADGLLAWGRNEAEAEAPGEVDLAALLAGLCEPDDALSYEGPASLTLKGRPVALSRAFSNILDNAKRYGGKAVVRLAADEAAVAVTVTDEGPGIPSERLADVLEPFTRLEESRSADTGGAGLGLAIAQTIIRAHAGTLHLENRTDDEGSGLVVTVTLPR